MDKIKSQTTIAEQKAEIAKLKAEKALKLSEESKSNTSLAQEKTESKSSQINVEQS